MAPKKHNIIANMDFLNNLAPLAPLALEATKFALKKTTSPASDLATEAAANNSKAVREILSKDSHIDRTPALVAAAALGNLSVLHLLLESPHKHRKIDVNGWSAGNTPLLSAVKNRHFTTTTLLLNSGAEPDLCPKTGITALQDAAGLGDIDIVEVLLSFKADVNHQNHAGDTALIIASRSGHARTARYLLEHGAEIEKKSKKGNTALAVAAKNGRVEVVEVLLDEGADVRVRDKKWRTPLHRAVEGTLLIDVSSREAIVKQLMRAGANPTAKDADGKTPADRVNWLNGGDTLKRLLEKRSKTWGSPRPGHPERSRTM